MSSAVAEPDGRRSEPDAPPYWPLDNLPDTWSGKMEAVAHAQVAFAVATKDIPESADPPGWAFDNPTAAPANARAEDFLRHVRTCRLMDEFGSLL